MDEVAVYDVETGEMRTMTRAEAAEGLMRYARSLGPGTPACAVWERRALEVLRGETNQITL